MNNDYTANIKINNDIKNKLTELGVYDDWLFFIQLKFNHFRRCRNHYEFCVLKKVVQFGIESGDIKQLINGSSPWFNVQYYDDWCLIFDKLRS